MGDMDMLERIVHGHRDHMADLKGRMHPSMLELERAGLVIWVSARDETFGGVWTATAKAQAMVRPIRKRKEIESARESLRAWEEELEDAKRHIKMWTKNIAQFERELAGMEVCDG